MLLQQANIRITPDDFQRISRVVYRYCGIHLHGGKMQLVQTRIAKRLRTSGFDSAAQYIDYVLANPNSNEFLNFIDSISTNLTSFFREKEHFDYLTHHFLPKLVNTASTNRIRAWSAGCSSGQEPYSMAMTLLDTFQAHRSFDVKILATDLSTQVLKMARAGVYEREQLEPVSPLQRHKYFQPVHGQHTLQVTGALREIIAFRHLNLMTEWPFKRHFDFIFCRNVMIYFDKPTQQQLINRFHQYLNSGGLLFTGHAESLSGIAHEFKYIQPSIYCKA